MTCRHDSEDGFTLIEVMMALIVLGIGVAALMTAMAMHVKTSFANKTQSEGAATLATAAEYVKSYTWNPTLVGATCPAISGSTVSTGGPGAPTGFTISYTDGQAVPSASMCELQKITVDVNGFGYDLQVDVLKRAATEVNS